MGVTHSMEEGQVKRISKALNGSAKAIQGINTKFDLIDEHVQKMMEFNRATNSKVNNVLSSFERLDDTFNDRAEMLLESLVGATNTLTEVLEAAAVSLDKVNIRQELDNIPKAMITLAIPFVILVIELAVSNAYLGILLASLPSVSLKYSNYLIAYASATLMGLFLSLMWLVCYRVWLSTSCQGRIAKKEDKTEETLQRLSRLRTRSQNFGDTLGSDSPQEAPEAKEAQASSDMDGSMDTSRTKAPTIADPAISWAKQRRLERKLQRGISQGDETLSLSESSQPATPLTSPVHSNAAMPLNLPPLGSVFESTYPTSKDASDDRSVRRSGIYGSEDAIQRAERLAAEAASFEMADPQDPARLPELAELAEPVPDEIPRGLQVAERSGSGPGKKSMVQMQWNSWQNPLKMDMTWGGRKADTSRSSTSATGVTTLEPKPSGVREGHEGHEGAGERNANTI